MKHLCCKDDDFCHIHTHSSFSIKDGSIPVRTIVDRQVERGAKGIAITDHGMLTGGWFLYDYIHNVKKYNGVKHIIGIECYLSETRDELMAWLPNSKELVEDKDERANERKRLNQKYHQILLCKNKEGYQNAIKIHNDAWVNGFYYSPTTTKKMIFEHSKGLIATTTCLASLFCRKIMAGDLIGAENEIRQWKDVFGEDFYVELQPTNNASQVMVNRELIKLARKTNTPIISTNDVHYENKEDSEFHFTLMNLANLKKQSEETESKLWEFSVDDLYLKSLEDMYLGWKKLHKNTEFTESVFEESILNVGKIVSSVEHYSLESNPLLPQVDNQDPYEKLKKDTIVGLKKKLDEGLIPKNKLKEYQDRIVEELETIHLLKAENYMNICAFMIEEARQRNIYSGLSRGSVGGSLVAYLLGITQIDPIQHKLLFARFLSKNRRPKLIL